LRRTDTAVHEWVGLAVYWLTGRSSELFPAPIRKERESCDPSRAYGRIERGARGRCIRVGNGRRTADGRRRVAGGGCSDPRIDEYTPYATMSTRPTRRQAGLPTRNTRPAES